MNCSECRYNMEDRKIDSPSLKGKVACKYRSATCHGFDFNTIVYVNPTDKCPYASPVPKPVRLLKTPRKKKDFTFGAADK